MDEKSGKKPIRVLLLDDREDSLVVRASILRQHGYEVVTSETSEEAQERLDGVDIAVLDYHLGAGKFGTEVAEALRQRRPQVPIIILSATLERKFGGIADMHLLKGFSSTDDLLEALSHFAAKKRGQPVVVNARDFYYSRISMAMGEDVVLEIVDSEGTWQYVNDAFADLFDRPRAWFAGRNLFHTFPEIGEEWREIILTVAEARETYVERSLRGLPNLPRQKGRRAWNVIAFPIKLHDGRPGVAVSARLIGRKGR